MRLCCSIYTVSRRIQLISLVVVDGRIHSNSAVKSATIVFLMILHDIVAPFYMVIDPVV